MQVHDIVMKIVAANFRSIKMFGDCVPTSPSFHKPPTSRTSRSLPDITNDFISASNKKAFIRNQLNEKDLELSRSGPNPTSE